MDSMVFLRDQTQALASIESQPAWNVPTLSLEGIANLRIP